MDMSFTLGKWYAVQKSEKIAIYDFAILRGRGTSGDSQPYMDLDIV